ncbi:MAG: hypothetical protein ABI379_06765 [Rhodanobacter sp.]
MIERMKFAAVPVSDQDRALALAFDSKKLGDEIAADQPMGPGQRWIELHIGHATTGLVLCTPEGHGGALQN